MPVVHCTAEFRADRAGSFVNCQLVAAMVRNPDHLLAGTPATELVDGLGPEPGDLVSPRLHGVSPFTGTSLDTWLRSLGVRTVVATGVSVNLGVLGLAIEAVNLGYSVVVPRDAVAGLPADYADAVLDQTFPLIAAVTTVDEDHRCVGTVSHRVTRFLWPDKGDRECQRSPSDSAETNLVMLDRAAERVRSLRGCATRPAGSWRWSGAPPR